MAVNPIARPSPLGMAFYATPLALLPSSMADVVDFHHGIPFQATLHRCAIPEGADSPGLPGDSRVDTSMDPRVK